jgi:hypothetical protein
MICDEKRNEAKSWQADAERCILPRNQEQRMKEEESKFIIDSLDISLLKPRS